MRQIIKFIQKERLYILLLAFIILLNIVMSTPAGKGAKVETEKHKAVSALGSKDLELMLAKDKTLAVILNLSSLLIFAILVLGFIIDMMLISFKLGKNRIDISTYKPKGVNWGISDVANVVVLFLFFGYMTVMTEASLARVFPILKDDNFRMIVNTSMLDMLAVVFIIYFTVARYHEAVKSLGLSVKNFLKNVLYGVIGYIAAAPILLAVLLLAAFLVSVTKYVPEKQPIVELFLKEKNAPFLVYTSLFAAIIGPFIEELFFRGFMYNAFKKTAGIFWATLVTAGLFAALHTNVIGFLPILVLGILLAYLYEKTGTLVSSITVHIMHNLSMVFFVFLIKKMGVYG